MNLTRKLKCALWKRFGSPEHSSEWDGKVYGGGKVSQRFWEYHQTIELMELSPDSVVLDIGGGSPATGVGFFAGVIAPFVKKIHIMDVAIGDLKAPSPQIEFHPSLANYDTLSALLREHPEITHISCVSVFEHIPQEVRIGMMRAVDEHFLGDCFAGTLEYHSRATFIEHQLTVRTMSGMFEGFTRFYLDKLVKSPVWCEDAFANLTVGTTPNPQPGAAGKQNLLIPLWYPLAFRFNRVEE